MADSNTPKTLLVVDDDKAILQIMKTMLESDGFSVILCQNGREAIDALRRVKISAVLLDLHLLTPDDGFEVLSKIKSIEPEIPVIMVTGSHDEAEARRAFELGAWDYLTKPVDFAYLKNILLLQTGEQ